MKQNKIILRFGTITCFILLAALSRLIPHPANFAPIGGMAILGAVHYNKRYWAYLIPIISMWISDLILNNVVYAQYFDHFVWFYQGSLFTYGAFALITLMATVTVKNIRVSNLLLAALSASVIFFLVSNFGVWVSSGMYPHSWSGLTACYGAAIPFFKNTILGDLCYTGVLFGIYELATRQFPVLRTEKV